MRLIPLMMVWLGLVSSAGQLSAQNPPVRPDGYTDRTSRRPALTPNPSADSLYMIARRALNQASYDSAIAAFREVAERYPVSYVAPNSWYWMAYALHRKGEERGSVADLRAARDAIVVHRTFYEDAYTRSDAIELIRPIHAAIVARGVESTTDQHVRRLGFTGNFYICEPPPSELNSKVLDGLDKLAPAIAADLLARTVFGEGMCLDLSVAGSLYPRLGKSAADKVKVIAALGRSLHPSSARELRAIASGESDQALKGLALEWLLFHSRS